MRKIAAISHLPGRQTAAQERHVSRYRRVGVVLEREGDVQRDVRKSLGGQESVDRTVTARVSEKEPEAGHRANPIPTATTR